MQKETNETNVNIVFLLETIILISEDVDLWVYVLIVVFFSSKYISSTRPLRLSATLSFLFLSMSFRRQFEVAKKNEETTTTSPLETFKEVAEIVRESLWPDSFTDDQHLDDDEWFFPLPDLLSNEIKRLNPKPNQHERMRLQYARQLAANIYVRSNEHAYLTEGDRTARIVLRTTALESLLKLDGPPVLAHERFRFVASSTRRVASTGLRHDYMNIAPTRFQTLEYLAACGRNGASETRLAQRVDRTTNFLANLARRHEREHLAVFRRLTPTTTNSKNDEGDDDNKGRSSSHLRRRHSIARFQQRYCCPHSSDGAEKGRDTSVTESVMDSPTTSDPASPPPSPPPSPRIRREDERKEEEKVVLENMIDVDPLEPWGAMIIPGIPLLDCLYEGIVCRGIRGATWDELTPFLPPSLVPRAHSMKKQLLMGLHKRPDLISEREFDEKLHVVQRFWSQAYVGARDSERLQRSHVPMSRY